ncbi:hypothetical protein GCM10027075_69750 [Streptomyces heilongjiangensis]
MGSILADPPARVERFSARVRPEAGPKRDASQVGGRLNAGRAVRVRPKAQAARCTVPGRAAGGGRPRGLSFRFP